MIDKIINTVITGDAREKLKGLPAGSVSCIITSPPYWALRDYGIEPMIWDEDMNCEHKWEGNQAIAPSNLAAAKEDKEWSTFRSEKYLNQPAFKPTTQFCSLCGAWRGCLGLEPTIELYLKHLVGIFDEAKRALRDDGTCFVNLGDTYNSNSGGYSDKWDYGEQAVGARKHRIKVEKEQKSLPVKSLCLIPFRFAIEMVNHGWILRNTIIWSKPNPMPSSAKDRFTVDFEYIFFFVKNNTVLWHYRPDGAVSDKQPDFKNGIEGLDWEWGMRKGKKVKKSLWEGFKYWFEQQYDDYTPNSDMEYRKTLRLGKFYRAGNQNPYKDNTPLAGDRKMTPLAEGKNKRTTWTIPTEAFPEAHFATFPCALVEPMIRAGCPEFVCKKCGKARVKVYERGILVGKDRKGNYSGREDDVDNAGANRFAGCDYHPGMAYEQIFKGYTSCSCNAGYEPGVVLDFFCGSGTVGKVAAYLRRNYILIDAKKEYCRMAEERIAEPESGVPVAEQRQGQGSLFEREGQ